MPKQYQPEKGGDGPSLKNEHDISDMGRGVKPPSLHGKHTLENKKEMDGINKPDLGDDMALEVRKAVVLDYIEGGGDGKGDAVSERTSSFKSKNPEWIDHSEVDELYPKS